MTYFMRKQLKPVQVRYVKRALMNIELYSVDQYPLDFEESWSLSILKHLPYLIHYPLLT